MEDLRVPLGRVSRWGRSESKAASTHLVHDVLEGIGAVNGKAHEDDVGLGVGQRPQAVVFLLAGGIPQGELDHLARGRMGRVGDVVLEDGGHVFLHRVRPRRVDRLQCGNVPRGSCLCYS